MSTITDVFTATTTQQYFKLTYPAVDGITVVNAGSNDARVFIGGGEKYASLPANGGSYAEESGGGAIHGFCLLAIGGNTRIEVLSKT